MAWSKYFSVEVPLLLCYFSQQLLNAISTNLYMYRACYVILGYNESDCAQLGNEKNYITKNLEPLVQPTVNKIDIALRIIVTGVPAVLGIFIGTWSDKYGRKPFLLICLLGLTIGTFLNVVIAYFPNISPWYFVLSAVPSSFTGGFTTVYVLIIMYIADVTTTKDRVLRMGIYEALTSSGTLLGSLLAPKIFYATSYVAVYAIGLFLILMSVVYIIFVIPESLVKVEKRIPTFCEIIKMVNLVEILKVPLKKREKNRRIFVIVMILLILMYNFSLMGDLSVRTLFLRKKLQWTLTKLSYASSYGSITFTLGALCGTTFLYKFLKMKEIQLVLLSVTMSTLANLTRALAVNDYYIYIAYTLVSFGGLFTSMLRTLLSYIVEPNEIGKIYATSNALDTLASTISSVLFPLIYNATIDINCGLFYYVNVGIGVGSFIVVIILAKANIPIRDDLIINIKEIEMKKEKDVKVEKNIKLKC